MAPKSTPVSTRIQCVDHPIEPPMKPNENHAQVVVIGGGVVGASVLYHLTKIGWTDVLLSKSTS